MVADEIAKLFPNLFGQPSSMLVPNGADAVLSDQKLKIGVVLSGGQAPGGHNVICGIFGEDPIVLTIRKDNGYIYLTLLCALNVICGGWW